MLQGSSNLSLHISLLMGLFLVGKRVGAKTMAKIIVAYIEIAAHTLFTKRSIRIVYIVVGMRYNR